MSKNDTNDIIKPYEWSGIIYGFTKEESKNAWDNVWEFINNIDMLKEFEEFKKVNDDNFDLYNFKEYIEEKYEYHCKVADTLFDFIGVDEFADYLKKKYDNFDYWVDVIETHNFRFK